MHDRVLTLQIPQAALHSSFVADTWLAWHSMPVRGTLLANILLKGVIQLTKLHDMVPADGAIINDNV